MTEKLYDKDSYIQSFEASVISCTQTDKGFEIVLDKTAFFPTEGGQECDTGTLGGATVKAVEIVGDDIYHYTDIPLEAGADVQGVIDFEERYRKMQNHSGEHIICGIAHKLHGCENVGFHLGADYVTMDLDKPLTEEELRAFIVANIAKHKVPKYITFVDSFPMNAAGKILKYKMREQAVELLGLQADSKIETA